MKNENNKEIIQIAKLKNKKKYKQWRRFGKNRFNN